MPVALVNGQVRYEPATRDKEGHRTYKVVWLVACGVLDGPSNAMQCPGLPLPGSTWLIDNDLDVWAFCQWDMEVSPMIKLGPNTYFEITQTFTTKPPDVKRCINAQFDDPLLQPQKISGSFAKDKEEATRDRFGRTILNSAFEQIRGPQVEFDKGSDTVVIEQNVPTLQLELFSPMKETVNAFVLWNLPPRCIKLSDAKWSRLYYGTCFPYFTRTFTFEIKTANDLGAVSATCNNPASEKPYKVGDKFTVQGGTYSDPAVLIVTQVDNTGQIQAVEIGDPGNYAVPPANPASVTDDLDNTSLLTFTINWNDVGQLVSGWDRNLLDEGTKVLRGHWDHNPASPTYQKYVIDNDPSTGKPFSPLNPQHFVKFRDYNGDFGKVILDGFGRPYDADTSTSNPGTIHVEKFTMSDFLQLGIPSTLNF